ncbi:MAG: hypothetical protein QG667_2416 [Pseudomonadota bacterium]|nr:hypothetical protein [Pseudomonadota bacterium]
MADFAVRLQGAPVLGCRPGCEAMGMRVAGQGHGPSPLVGCAATWWAQSGRLVECLGALSEGLGRGGLPRFDLAVELIRALTRDVLSGSSSRSRATFFCFAKRKYPKKRRPEGHALRCATGDPALLKPRGGCGTRKSLRALLKQSSRTSPHWTAMLGVTYGTDPWIRNHPSLAGLGRVGRLLPTGIRGQ